MVIPPDAMPPAVLVALVNGWGTVARHEAGESELPYPDLGSVVEAVTFDLVGEQTDGERLRRLADALYPVFATDDPDLRADQVTRLLDRYRVRPAVAVRVGRIEEAWDVHGSEILGAAAVVSLRGLLLQQGPDRLGICSGARCGDVYVDASPAGHRRYCSVTCQNRARVAAFRRRHAVAKPVASPPSE